MDKFLIETKVDNCVYLGTSDNFYLVLKKYNTPQSAPYENVVVNSDTKIIGEEAFKDCTIASLTLGRNITKIQKDAFKGCAITGNLSYSGTINEWCSIYFETINSNPIQYTSNHSITDFGSSFTVNLDNIEAYAFVGYNINTITIGSNVSRIKNAAFLNCTISSVKTADINTWKNIRFDSKYSNPTYYSRKLYDNSNNLITTISVNDNVLNYAYINLSDLETVNIGSNVYYIGTQAFAGCTSLVFSSDHMGRYLGTTNKVLMDVCDITGDPETDLLEESYVGVSADLDINYKGYLDRDKTILARYDGEIAETTNFILNNACYGADLTDIVMPEPLYYRYIGSQAFKNCKGLQYVAISSGVQYIGPRCFEGCIDLTNVNLRDCWLETVPAYCFALCGSLETVTFPRVGGSGCLIIETGSFANCSKLHTVDSLWNVREIQNEAFLQCISLGNAFDDNKIELGPELRYIGYKAFYHCESLQKIILRLDYYLRIEEDSFACCFGLVEVCFLSNTASLRSLLIGSPTLGYLTYYVADVVYDLNDCGSLYTTDDGFVLYGKLNGDIIDMTTATVVKYVGTNTSITVPEVKRIKPYAFYNNQDIVKVTVPNLTNRLISVGEGAFSKCFRLQFNKDEQGLCYVGGETPYFILVTSDPNYDYTNVNYIEITNNTKFICPGALNSLLTLTKIVSPMAGDKLSKLDLLTTDYISPLGNIFGKSRIIGENTSDVCLYTCFDNIYYSHYYIPSGLTEIKLTAGEVIPDGGFNNYKLLQTVTLPSEVKSIGAGAFSDCDQMSNVDFGNSLTNIGYGAFFNCSGITEVNIPATVNTIDGCAFQNCVNITEINIEGSLQEIGENVFNNCPLVESITIPYTGNNHTEPHVGYMFGTKSYSGSTLTDGFYIPDALTSVTVTDYVAVNGAFRNCSRLLHIELPATSTEITTLSYTFDNCTSLLDVNIPSGITRLGYNVFTNCSSLTSLIIPESVTQIGSGSLSGCSSLVSLSIPFTGDKVVPSSNSATLGYIFGTTNFDGAAPVSQRVNNYPTTYRTFYIPWSLREVNYTSSGGGYVRYNAFENCYMLSTITLPEGCVEIGDEAFKGCTNLVKINYPSTLATVRSSAFYGCNKLIEIYNLSQLSQFPSSVQHVYSMGGNSYLSTSEDGYIIYNDGSNVIFIECVTNPTEIIIPETVTEIYQGALFNCGGLEKITLPFIGQKVGAASSSHESYITYIFGSQEYPNSTRDNYYGDWIPSSLEEVSVINPTLAIPEEASNDAAWLKTLTLDVSEIGVVSFGYSGLTTLNLSDNLTEIGDESFDGCDGLTTINYNGTTTQWGQITFGTNWHRDVPATVVHCSDGDVNL